MDIHEFTKSVQGLLNEGWKIREEGMFENHEQMYVHWASLYREVSG